MYTSITIHVYTSKSINVKLAKCIPRALSPLGGKVGGMYPSNNERQSEQERQRKTQRVEETKSERKRERAKKRERDRKRERERER